MLEIVEYDIYGWQHAIKGMRLPMNSGNASDSFWYDRELNRPQQSQSVVDRILYTAQGGRFCYIAGENDLKLMRTLARGAGSDRKFMRMIQVWVFIKAPMYWWKEFDTYKIGTVRDSSSTMHKIHAKEFTLQDFSHEHFCDLEAQDGLIGFDDLYIEPEAEGLTTLPIHTPKQSLQATIDILNFYRQKYLYTKDKKYWWQLIQLLPSTYNQISCVNLNYEVLRTMWHDRHNHKLDEWHVFCHWIETLPLSNYLLCNEETKSNKE